MDSRRFTDTYDLYRQTVTVSASGASTVSDPDTATDTDCPCRFFDGPTPDFRMGERGVEQQFDATMLVPADADLKAAKRGQQPDVVLHDSRYWLVQSVVDVAGRGKFLRVGLTERG